MPNILLTGFEPFGGEQVNHAWQAVQPLDGWQPDHEVTVHTRQLPCVFNDCIQQLQQLITELKPVLVIAVGQASGRNRISLEKVAINLNDARIADNHQQQPIDTPVIPDGPDAYFSTLPLKALLQQLKQQHIPAEISYTAGTFVCNHLFYGLMHHLSTNNTVRAGFIHIPLSPAQTIDLPGSASMNTDDIIRALKTITVVSLQQKEDILLAAGTLY